MQLQIAICCSVKNCLLTVNAYGVILIINKPITLKIF